MFPLIQDLSIGKEISISISMYLENICYFLCSHGLLEACLEIREAHFFFPQLASTFFVGDIGDLTGDIFGGRFVCYRMCLAAYNSSDICSALIM